MGGQGGESEVSLWGWIGQNGESLVSVWMGTEWRVRGDSLDKLEK